MDAALASFIPNISLPHSSNLIRPESFIQVKRIQHFLHLSFGQRRSILGWHTSRYGTVLVCCTRVSVCYLLIVPWCNQSEQLCSSLVCCLARAVALLLVMLGILHLNLSRSTIHDAMWADRTSNLIRTLSWDIRATSIWALTTTNPLAHKLSNHGRVLPHNTHWWWYSRGI